MIDDLVSDKKYIDVQIPLRQIEVLKAAADLSYGGPPDYEKSVVGHISKALGIGKKTVGTHLYRMYDRLEVRDIFSAVYEALHRGIISPAEVANGSLSDLIVSLEKLSRREREVFRAFADMALSSRDKGKAQVKEILDIADRTLRNHKTRIYGRLEIHNNAQLAVAAYILSHSQVRQIVDKSHSYAA